MLRLKTSQIGDTIVEVMIAMAILGVILAGAYVTANRSLNAERNAQEHSQALTIAQGQIEDLYANVYKLCTSSAGPCSNNCFDTTNPANPTKGKYCFVSNNNQFCLSASATNPPVGCTPAPTQPAGYYYQISDSRIDRQQLTIPTTPPTIIFSPTYEVQISWPSLTGNTAYVQLYYRPQ